jgi:hypothetical protein
VVFDRRRYAHSALLGITCRNAVVCARVGVAGEGSTGCDRGTFILWSSSRLPVVCQGTGVSRFFFINFCRKVSEAADRSAVSPACLKERQLRSAREVVVVVRDGKPVRNFFLFQRFFLWEHGLIRQKNTTPHAPACPHTPGIHLQLLLLLCDLPLRVLVILLVSNANISDILL